ncbi:hypothetical protein NVP1170O_165 [Vibrio phage 1.170.O._10N.261.52.C3]|nr:hypothetical protein NVP1170O_165 [Vibrio phage 1.170.O._10N.261.52.C3]
MIKVMERSRTEEAIEEYDYRDAYEITQDGKSIFKVSDGEPEDSNLCRDFSDVYSVGDLLKKFYQLGKDGIEVEFDSEQVDEL